MRKIVWLFGENEGRTLNNNSFYFWEQICSIDDEILKYYVVEKNDNNVKIVSTFSDKLKDKIVWKNSEEHIKVFNESDTHIVSLSYKDVTPTIYDEDIGPTKPTIYLQHGTTAIKKLGYKGFGYKNNFYKFIYYNKEMFDKFQKENDFKKYQLYYMIAHPRYMELVRRNNLKKKKRQFLYFLTWKEYLGDNKETRNLINNITNLVLNKDLVKYLKDNKITFKLCVHQFFVFF